MWFIDPINREAMGRYVGKAMRPSARFTHCFLLVFLLLSPAMASNEDEPDVKQPLSLFGQRYLKEAELAAEVVVGKVYNLGMGVDVVRVKLGRVIYNQLPVELARRSEQLVLAYRDEFKEGTQLFLILKRFGEGDRLQAIHRLSHLEKHYTAKIDLMAAYIAVEQLEDGPKKVEALVSMVLENLRHESVWYRQNGLFELKGLVDQKSYPFTRGDVEYLMRVANDSEDNNLKKDLTALCEIMTESAVEGPCILEKVNAPEKEDVPPPEDDSKQD